MPVPAPEFDAAPSVVGSFPHATADALVDDILARFPAFPAWPQLPARDWRESMYVQYSEGLPGAVIDAETQRIYFQRGPDFEPDLERFYQAIIEEDVDRFAISRDYALGLHRFLEKFPRGATGRPRSAKGQVTGPFSFAMTVTDEAKRSLAYTPEFHEIATQGMAMKARWMARRLREAAGSALVVLDEPYLCAFGSAFVNVSREDVAGAIDRRGRCHPRGGGAGGHPLLRQHGLVARVLHGGRRRQLRRVRVLPGDPALPRAAGRVPRQGRCPELGNRADRAR